MADDIINRADARASGLKYYFTGKPCINGHLEKRFVSSGGCPKCVNERNYKYHKANLEKFRERKRGYYAADPEKHRERSRKYLADNKEKVLERERRYRSENAEKIRELSRNRYAKNPVKFREAARKYRKDNSAKVREQWRVYRETNRKKVRESYRKWALKNSGKRLALRREYYETNRAEFQKRWRKYYVANAKKLGESSRKYRAENPEKHREWWRNRRARRVSAPGNHTAQDISNIYKLQSGKCAYCRVKLNGKYHVDHIIALFKGGSNDRRNLQLLCGAKCNSAKGIKDPIDFARELGRLL